MIKVLDILPIMPIYEISKRVSYSPKTESKRLANMKEKRILIFIVATNP